jgi:2'-5' RNA ligase
MDVNRATPGRRLFIGLMPDAGVCAQIASHQRQWFWPPDSRPTRPSQLHLTLHFLGEVEGDDEERLRDALATVEVEALHLVLRTPECWSGGVTVLRPDPDAALRALHARITRALAVRGLRSARERAWTPHVTLARDAAGAAPPEATRPVIWNVDCFAMVWSRSTPPAGYEVLRIYGGLPGGPEQ